MMTERLWGRLEENEDGCWIWQGGKNKSGYGAIGYNRKKWRVHRLAYELTYRDLDPDDVVMHLCNNKLCCNPEHLRVGTQADNLAQAGEEGKMTRSVGPATRSKLSQEDIDYIKFSELSNRTLAKMYGFSCHKAISAIRRGYYKDARRV